MRFKLPDLSDKKAKIVIVSLLFIGSLNLGVFSAAYQIAKEDNQRLKTENEVEKSLPQNDYTLESKTKSNVPPTISDKNSNSTDTNYPTKKYDLDPNKYAIPKDVAGEPTPYRVEIQDSTKQSNPSQSSKISYEQAQSSCSAKLAQYNAVDSSAFASCMHAYGY